MLDRNTPAGERRVILRYGSCFSYQVSICLFLLLEKGWRLVCSVRWLKRRDRNPGRQGEMNGQVQPSLDLSEPQRLGRREHFGELFEICIALFHLTLFEVGVS